MMKLVFSNPNNQELKEKVMSGIVKNLLPGFTLSIGILAGVGLLMTALDKYWLSGKKCVVTITREEPTEPQEIARGLVDSH